MTDITATAAVMANDSNLGNGRRCVPFHLSKAELVLVGRDLFSIGGTTLVNHGDLGCEFLRIPASRLSTDAVPSLETSEALTGLMERRFQESRRPSTMLSLCTEGEDMVLIFSIPDSMLREDWKQM